jgi:hypothetical protein
MVTVAGPVGAVNLPVWVIDPAEAVQLNVTLGGGPPSAVNGVATNWKFLPLPTSTDEWFKITSLRAVAAGVATALAEASLSPSPFLATTVTVYATPFVKPVIVVEYLTGGPVVELRSTSAMVLDGAVVPSVHVMM